MAHAQLHLIYIDDEMWKLDERTIRVGRKGLAEARAALARNSLPFTEEPFTERPFNNPAFNNPAFNSAALTKKAA